MFRPHRCETASWPSACKVAERRSGAVTSRARQVLRFVEVHKPADKQVEAAVVVIVKPHRACGPSCSGDASFLGYIGEGAVPIVVIQDASAVLGDVQIRKAVSVVVAHSHALAVAATSHTGLLSYVGKSSVTIVSVQSIAQ